MAAFKVTKPTDWTADSQASEPEGVSKSEGQVGTDSDSFTSLVRQVAQTPEASPVSYLAPGTVVKERYSISKRLGVGGMAVVYLATDLKLNRKVALKLQRTSTQASSVRRLAEEAKAMARLSHPNVVSVFELELIDQEILFIAMEYVEGQTLRAWLGQSPRSVKEILDVFIQAGQGLAAAHAAGLVHLDFKPENVLVSTSGRVQVADFGLSRMVEAAPVPTQDGPKADTEDPDGASTEGQGQGYLLGTPAYMAPEQLRGVDVDARTDQYSFCIALYEALAKKLPLDREGEGEAKRIQSARIAEMPNRRGIPRFVQRALRRGLSFRPEDRFEDMPRLLVMLRRGLVRRARLVYGALTMMSMAVVGITVGLMKGKGTPPPPLLCTGAEKRVQGVWNDKVKREIAKGFAATGVAHASRTWALMERLLDRYTAKWIASWKEGCEATRVRKVQSERMLDRRMGCLDSRLTALFSLLQALRKPTPQVVENGVTAAERLPPLYQCQDRRYLMAQVKPPEDPSVARQVKKLRGQLSLVMAYHRSGRPIKALKLAEETARKAESLPYPPILAEAYHHLGLSEHTSGRRLNQAETHLRKAYFIARGSGHDLLALQASTLLIQVVGNDLLRFRDGLDWAEHAKADSRRLGNDRLFEAKMFANLGFLLEGMGRYDEAYTYHLKALERYRAVQGESFGVAIVLNLMGSVMEAKGERAKAIRHYHQALEVAEKALGKDHPLLCNIISNYGLSLSALGRHEEAIALQERGLDISERAFGSASTTTGFGFLNLGVAFQNALKLEKAVKAYRKALEIVQNELGPNHPDTALCLTHLGTALDLLGRFQPALEMHKKALGIYENRLGKDHLNVGLAAGNLGVVYNHLGQHRRAVVLLKRAIGIWDRKAKSAPGVAFPLTALGSALIDLERPVEAIGPLERALAIRLTKGVANRYVAATRITLACALFHSGKDRVRAQKLASEAVQGYTSLGQLGEAQLRKIRKWLKKNGCMLFQE